MMTTYAPIPLYTQEYINAMNQRDHKTYESRLRRAAARQGLMLHKSRRRDPLAYDYGEYKIIDSSGMIVADRLTLYGVVRRLKSLSS